MIDSQHFIDCACSPLAARTLRNLLTASILLVAVLQGGGKLLGEGDEGKAVRAGT